MLLTWVERCLCSIANIANLNRQQKTAYVIAWLAWGPGKQPILLRELRVFEHQGIQMSGRDMKVPGEPEALQRGGDPVPQAENTENTRTHSVAVDLGDVLWWATYSAAKVFRVNSCSPCSFRLLS